MPTDSLAMRRFGERIRHLRNSAKKTQRELSAAAGIDYTYLSKLENGRGEPPAEATIRRLASELNADPQELLALALKMPRGLRDRAASDPQLAILLTRLPTMSRTELRSVYRAAGIQQPSSTIRKSASGSPGA